MVDPSESASHRVASLERALRAALPNTSWAGLGLLRVEDVRRPSGRMVSLDRVHAAGDLLASAFVHRAWPLRRYHGHLLVAVELRSSAPGGDGPREVDPMISLEWLHE